MTWLRFDDNYPNHPKVLGLTAEAFTLNTCAICYAGRHHTDGFIPAAVVPRLWHFRRRVSVSSLVAELLAVRLWEEVPERNGYTIHDFLEYNPCKADLAPMLHQRSIAGRGRAATAARVGGRFSKEPTSGATSDPPAGYQRPAGAPAGSLLSTSTSGITSGAPAGGDGEGDPTNEVQTEQERQGGSDSGLSLLPTEALNGVASFEDFWRLYPRRKAKPAARAAWGKLHVTPALWQAMRAAIERGLRDPDWVREGGKFIPHPASWLNGHRWEDEETAVPLVSETTARNEAAMEEWLRRTKEG